MEQVKHAKDQGTASLEKACSISTNLTVSVEDVVFGRYIQIKRDGRWICLSASLWKIIHQHLEKLRTIGEVVYLTKSKRLEVINYNDRRYVSFVQVSPYQGIDYKYYINFNDDEWTTLLDIMVKINNMLFCQLPRPIPLIGDISDEPTSKRNDFNECHGVKRPIHLTVDKRMKKTKLSKKKLATVLEYNVGVQTQLGLMCTYCGVEGYHHDDCHCHKYDCSLCEPDNFCNECLILTVCEHS